MASSRLLLFALGKLQLPFLVEIISHAVGRGDARWQQQGECAFIFWKRPEELAAEILIWSQTQPSGSIFTVWEMLHDEQQQAVQKQQHRAAVHDAAAAHGAAQPHTAHSSTH